MKDFFKFIYCKRIGIAFFILLAFFLAGAFWLYELPVLSVLYPCFVAALLGLLLLLLMFLRERSRLKHLENARKNRILDISELPPAVGRIEEEYTNLVGELLEENLESHSRLKAEYDALIDYYTLWAHQIKTPISSMRLKLQNEDTPLARWLRLDLSRIESYVEMVLAYLRLDSEYSDYVLKECDVDEILRSAIKKFSGEFINRGLSLNYMPVGMKVLSDEKWLAFVIEQILSNALKYTREGSITIESEGTELLIRDTGIGIAESDLPRVFEKGFTGFTGREDKRATGLGLYLCKRICDKLEHSLKIESKVGMGTVVRIGLDRREYGFE